MASFPWWFRLSFHAFLALLYLSKILSLRKVRDRRGLRLPFPLLARQGCPLFHYQVRLNVLLPIQYVQNGTSLQGLGRSSECPLAGTLAGPSDSASRIGMNDHVLKCSWRCHARGGMGEPAWKSRDATCPAVPGSRRWGPLLRRGGCRRWRGRALWGSHLRGRRAPWGIARRRRAGASERRSSFVSWGLGRVKGTRAVSILTRCRRGVSSGGASSRQTRRRVPLRP
jgi:hypothetical protein